MPGLETDTRKPEQLFWSLLLHANGGCAGQADRKMGCKNAQGFWIVEVGAPPGFEDVESLELLGCDKII